MTTTQASVNAVPFLTTAGLSNRLLARRLFDNGRHQREHRHQWRSDLELIAGEGDDPLYFEFRHRQLTEIVDDLVWLEAEAGSISAEIARRRQTGGAR
jgi:hypothetical protein